MVDTQQLTFRGRAPRAVPRAAVARTAVLGAVLATALAGCGGPAPEAPPPPAATPPPVTTTAAPAPDEAFCAEFASIRNAVGQIDTAAGRGPVLPAAVALLLLAPRSAASAPGIEDPELAAALEELVAAIDDVDAQGRERLPEGGNPATDPVALDTERLVAAVEDVQRACDGR